MGVSGKNEQRSRCLIRWRLKCAKRYGELLVIHDVTKRTWKTADELNTVYHFDLLRLTNTDGRFSRPIPFNVVRLKQLVQTWYDAVGELGRNFCCTCSLMLTW